MTVYIIDIQSPKVKYMHYRIDDSLKSSKRVKKSNFQICSKKFNIYIFKYSNIGIKISY